MSNRCHPPFFSTQIFRGSLLTRPQNKGRGQVVPPKSPFPAKFIFHVFFHVYNLSTSTCTLDLPSSTCTLVLLRTTSHNTPIHNSTKIPTTEMILGDVESSSDIGSGNSSSCNTLPPSLPYFWREVFTAPITRQRQWRQRTWRRVVAASLSLLSSTRNCNADILLGIDVGRYLSYYMRMILISSWYKSSTWMAP